MSEPRKAIGSMHFGPFDLSPELSELRKHGQRPKLSGQAIDVLLMLASNAGRLVTREELQRKLWPGDSFGDFEHGLNAAVNRLRETLLDEARRHKGVLALMVVVLSTLIAGVGIYLFRLSEGGSEWNLQGMKISRVTQSGNAANVAISPDGRYVVYALVEGEKQSLNIRQVATGSDCAVCSPMLARNQPCRALPTSENSRSSTVAKGENRAIRRTIYRIELDVVPSRRE